MEDGLHLIGSKNKTAVFAFPRAHQRNSDKLGPDFSDLFRHILFFEVSYLSITCYLIWSYMFVISAPPPVVI